MGVSVQDVQVVVLAGGTGSRMYPITDAIPKSFLPVSNRPLISYPLELLQKSGIKDVILVTRERVGSEVQEVLSASCPQLTSRMNLDIVNLTDDDDLGTADALFKIRHKLHTDFIVISSDLLYNCPSTFKGNLISSILNFHRLNNSLLTILLHQPVSSGSLPASGASGAASGNSEASLSSKAELGLLDWIGFSKVNKNQIVFYKNAADVDDSLHLKKSILREGRHIDLRKDVNDGHFYLFHPSSLVLLEQNKKKISSIKGEFIPFLVRNQFSSSNPPSTSSSGVDKVITVGKSSIRIWSSSSFQQQKQQPQINENQQQQQQQQNDQPLPNSDQGQLSDERRTSSTSDLRTQSSNPGVLEKSRPQDDDDDEMLKKEVRECFGFIVESRDGDEGFCCRSNTFSHYLTVNKQIATGKNGYQPNEKFNQKAQNFISDLAEISQKTQVGAECVVGHSQIGDRCSVKKSVIGNFCKIGNNVKINSSVIMDHVVIENNCVIQGSVICSKVRIGDKSTIKDCQISVSYNLPASSEVKNEMLV